MENAKEEVLRAYPFADLVKYKEYLGKIAGNSTEKIFNDSPVHASLVMRELLKRSKKEAYMYCGKFSIFRENFKRKLEELFSREIYKDCDFSNFKPYEESVDALVTFLSNSDAQMEVITEDDISAIKQDNYLWGKIKTFVENGKLRFCKMRDDVLKGLFHFVVMDDKGFRMESSNELKTAVCCLYDTESASNLKAYFEVLRNDAKRVTFEMKI